MNDSKKKKHGSVTGKAVTTISPTVFGERLSWLARKSFALAIHEYLGAFTPNAEEVVFTEGAIQHECKWKAGDGTEFSGTFYHCVHQPDNQGTVCISCVSSLEGTGYPFSWHHLFFVDEAYEEITMPIEEFQKQFCNEVIQVKE